MNSRPESDPPLGERPRIVDVEEERVKIVIFSIADELYAFYGADVREILPPAEISPVPGLPGFLPGLINVRGDVESVVDIRHFLQIPAPPLTQGFIVLADKNGIRSGVLVDVVIDVDDIPVGDISPPLSTLEAGIREFVIGEFDYGARSVALLDVGNIFAKIAL